MSEVQVSEAEIAVHWREEEYFYPSTKFIGQANANDPAIRERFAEKNYPDLLHAAKIVLESAPGVLFVAAGGGPLADELAALQGALGLGDRFVFLGFRLDAVRMLAGADIFTLGSAFEGYPVAVMEALLPYCANS